MFRILFFILIFFPFDLLGASSTPPQFFDLTACQLSSDPASLATDCTDIQPPLAAMPSLYDGTVATTYYSKFGANYFKISIPSGVTDSVVKQMFPVYAKIPAWNADGTLLMIQANNGFLHLLDGKTYKYISRLDNSVQMFYTGTDPEPRWSKTDPNIFYYVYKMEFRAYNVSAKTSTTIHTFTDAECGSTGLTMIHNGDEGNSDDNDRFWAWYVQDGSYAQKAIIVYDMLSDTVISAKGFSAGGVCGTAACPTSANWVGMSHSGNHVVINWNTDAPDGVLTQRGKGSEAFSRSLTYLSTSSEKNWHCDLAQLENGQDVFVGASHLSSPNGYKAIRAVNLDNGTIETSCMLPVSQYEHISGRTLSSELRSWILYSTYDQTGKSMGTGTFAAENFAVNMDTCEVRRIVHTQSTWSSSNYYSEPHSSVNFDFTKIIWGSNWGDPAANVQAYVVELKSEPRPKILSIK